MKTTDRNGWPAEIDETGTTRTVTFPNGNQGVYKRCYTCNGTGAVTASWGLDYFCNVCACTGWRFDHAVHAEVASR